MQYMKIVVLHGPMSWIVQGGIYGIIAPFIDIPGNVIALHRIWLDVYIREYVYKYIKLTSFDIW